MESRLRYGPRRHTRRYVFQPPRHVPLFMAFGRLVAPLYLRSVLHVTRVEMEQPDRERLNTLRDERVVLTPNHPTHDPVVLFQVSSMLGMRFNWLAAREVFENPVQNFVASRVGAYSVDRGAADADALHTTRQLIRDGRNWLVLFPEGMEHHLHNVVMPFLPGAARLGLGALSDLAEAGGEPPAVRLVPVASRYYYTADMRPVMHRELKRLEQPLGLAFQGPGDWVTRLDRIIDVVLSLNEEYYGLPPEPDMSSARRLDRLRERVISRVADSLRVEVPDPAKPLRNRVRRLMTIAHRRMQEPPGTGGDYGRVLAGRRNGWALRLIRDLRRVMEFVSITPDFAEEPLTVENYLDVVGRIEAEVLGRWRCFGPRRVLVRTGEPLDLREYLDHYRDDADEAGEAAMLEVETRVSTLLRETEGLMTQLPE